jgi:arsenate reductase
MKNPPTRDELEAIVAKLEDPVADLVRKDSRFKKLELDEQDYQTAEAVIDLLVGEKALLQRPIIVTEDKAIIGRPKERVRELLSS